MFELLKGINFGVVWLGGNLMVGLVLYIGWELFCCIFYHLDWSFFFGMGAWRWRLEDMGFCRAGRKAGIISEVIDVRKRIDHCIRSVEGDIVFSR